MKAHPLLLCPPPRPNLHPFPRHATAFFFTPSIGSNGAKSAPRTAPPRQRGRKPSPNRPQQEMMTPLCLLEFQVLSIARHLSQPDHAVKCWDLIPSSQHTRRSPLNLGVSVHPTAYSQSRTGTPAMKAHPLLLCPLSVSSPTHAASIPSPCHSLLLYTQRR